MFHAEGAGVVQRAVAHHGDHRQAEAGGDGDGLKGVEPAHAAGAAEGARAHGGGVLDDFKLRVLALGDDEVAVKRAVGLELGHVLHDRVVGPDGVGGDYVNVGKGAGDGDGLAAADEFFPLGVSALGLGEGLGGH